MLSTSVFVTRMKYEYECLFVTRMNFSTLWGFVQVRVFICYAHELLHWGGSCSQVRVFLTRINFWTLKRDTAEVRSS